VHYPEELIEPWVESEAGRVGMTESERTSYKEGFVSELSIGKMEPFLFTVYAFSTRPLSFSPISEKVALVTADGKRVQPVRYDRALDNPISGVVQGLVFFPKQEDKNFALAVRGMGVYDERIFAFSEQLEEKSAATVESEENTDVEVVVVELPPAPAPKKDTEKNIPPPRQDAPKVIERPVQTQATLEPPKAPEIVIVEPEESQSMSDFVAALRSDEPNETGQVSQDQDAKLNSENAYSSREQTLRTFLDLWVKQNPETMYSMLSESSQKLFSRETFEADLRKAADFRGALRDGYTLDWLGAERAKIVAVKRILLIRTLVSRTFGVVRENSAWKIVW
jgi:hypothetical protein